MNGVPLDAWSLPAGRGFEGGGGTAPRRPPRQQAALAILSVGAVLPSNAAASRAEARSRRHICDPLCREVGALRGVGRSHREGVDAGARVLRLEPQLPRLLAESAAPRDADSGAPDGGDPHVASLLVD